MTQLQYTCSVGELANEHEAGKILPEDIIGKRLRESNEHTKIQLDQLLDCMMSNLHGAKRN